jgi:VPDSG-CTERM motif
MTEVRLPVPSAAWNELKGKMKMKTKLSIIIVALVAITSQARATLFGPVVHNPVYIPPFATHGVLEAEIPGQASGTSYDGVLLRGGIVHIDFLNGPLTQLANITWDLTGTNTSLWLVYGFGPMNRMANIYSAAFSVQGVGTIAPPVPQYHPNEPYRTIGSIDLVTFRPGDPPNGIPDTGSTVALFGIGLGALALWRTRCSSTETTHVTVDH